MNFKCWNAWRPYAGVCVLPLFAVACGPPPLVIDPVDTVTPIASVGYESAFERPPDGAGDVRLGEQPLPWTALFNPDGSFVSEAELDGAPAGASVPEKAETYSKSTNDTVSDSKFDAQGVVKAVYPDRGKVKLKHGPIEKLAMPAMTMVFAVKDQARLSAVKEGDEVEFSVVQEGGDFVVTDFMTARDLDVTRQPASAPKAAISQSDAEGVVKAVYLDRNKIKLKHGPIEKLDMPGMTMVFGVDDAALLEGLDEGDEVKFSIEMQGNGFVITGFEK